MSTWGKLAGSGTRATVFEAMPGNSEPPQTRIDPLWSAARVGLPLDPNPRYGNRLGLGGGAASPGYVDKNNNPAQKEIKPRELMPLGLIATSSIPETPFQRTLIARRI